MPLLFKSFSFIIECLIGSEQNETLADFISSGSDASVSNETLLKSLFQCPFKSHQRRAQEGRGEIICLHSSLSSKMQAPVPFISTHFQNVQYYEFTPNFVCVGHTCHLVCSRKLVKNQVHYFHVLIDKVVQPELNRRYAAYNKEQWVYLPV